MLYRPSVVGRRNLHLAEHLRGELRAGLAEGVRLAGAVDVHRDTGVQRWAGARAPHLGIGGYGAGGTGREPLGPLFADQVRHSRGHGSALGLPPAEYGTDEAPEAPSAPTPVFAT